MDFFIFNSTFSRFSPSFFSRLGLYTTQGIYTHSEKGEKRGGNVQKWKRRIILCHRKKIVEIILPTAEDSYNFSRQDSFISPPLNFFSVLRIREIPLSIVCVSYKWGEGERGEIAAGIQNTHVQQVGGKESSSPRSSLLINIGTARNSTFFPQNTHLL